MSPRRALVGFVLVVAVALGAYSLISRAAVAWDLTAERSATLSDETKRVLRRVDERIEITAFFPREAAGRVEAATLLSRYREVNRRITYRILDPEIAPGEAQRLGVDEVGSAAVQEVAERDDVEIAQYTIEIDVTSAIARLLRDVQGTVCFSAGHGERSTEETTADALSEAVSLLKGNGYRTRTVDLVSGASKLDRCDAIVVAAPTNRISKRVQRRVAERLATGGKILLLADPKADADLTPLSKPWGIRFIGGTVLEGDEGSHLPQDITSPIVSRYSGGSAIVRGLGPTFFPGALGVVAKSPDDPGTTAAEIAFTSKLGYLDRSNLESFDEDVDVAGPIALAASADDSEVQAPGTRRVRIRRTRLLAFGDADFASNAFIHDGANAKLFVQGIDWLTQPEDLVTAVPNFPKLRELELTQARNRYMLFLMAGVVPGLFVIAGGVVWVLRRSR